MMYDNYNPWNRERDRNERDRLQRERDAANGRYEELRERTDREREQAWEREKQIRHERQEAMNPSSRLYNGEISDFAEAMQAVADSARNELATTQSVAEHLSAETLASTTASITAYANDANEAAAIWREEYRSFMNALAVTVAHRLRERATETANQNYALFADALESDDYSPLAI